MKKYDVSGIGNPILDFIFNVDDSMIDELGLEKGQMKLINKIESQNIFNRLGFSGAEISPGGSSANALAGVSFLGGKTIFFGKIGNDKYGRIYEKKTKEQGVKTKLAKHPDEITGHAITLITPDFERTFAVHLGAARFFDKNDLEDQDIIDSLILHIEGFQLEDSQQRETAISAMEIAKKNNVLVSLDLSDASLVKRNLIILKDIVKDYVDIVFANEIEAKAFTGKNPEEAVCEISKICKIAIVKIGENGSFIRVNNETHHMQARKTKVVSTNGAGDMYAAGILYGISNNLDIEKSGRIATFISSLVVEIPGARLEKSKSKMVKEVVSLI